MAIPDSTASLIVLLDAERRALVAQVASVPDSRRTQRPDADRWSVAEVLEHLATVERGVVRLLQSRLRDNASTGKVSDVPPATRMDPARAARLRDRSERIEAPDRVKPRGVLGWRAALEALGESRASLTDALRLTTAERLDGATHVHPVLGTLTLLDWVQFVAHHEARHAEQIGEIAQALAVTAGHDNT